MPGEDTADKAEAVTDTVETHAPQGEEDPLSNTGATASAAADSLDTAAERYVEPAAPEAAVEETGAEPTRSGPVYPRMLTVLEMLEESDDESVFCGPPSEPEERDLWEERQMELLGVKAAEPQMRPRVLPGPPPPPPPMRRMAGSGGEGEVTFITAEEMRARDCGISGVSSDAGVPGPPKDDRDPKRPSTALIAPAGDLRGDNQKFICVFAIGLDDDEEFCLVKRILGKAGNNMRRIADECNAKVRLRGIGSGFLEGSDGKEAAMPLQLNVSCVDYPSYQGAVDRVAVLLKELYKHYRRYSRSKGWEPPDVKVSLEEVRRDDLRLDLLAHKEQVGRRRAERQLTEFYRQERKAKKLEKQEEAAFAAAAAAAAASGQSHPGPFGEGYGGDNTPPMDSKRAAAAAMDFTGYADVMTAAGRRAAARAGGAAAAAKVSAAAREQERIEKERAELEKQRLRDEKEQQERDRKQYESWQGSQSSKGSGWDQGKGGWDQGKGGWDQGKGGWDQGKGGWEQAKGGWERRQAEPWYGGKGDGYGGGAWKGAGKGDWYGGGGAWKGGWPGEAYRGGKGKGRWDWDGYGGAPPGPPPGPPPENAVHMGGSGWDDGYGWGRNDRMWRGGRGGW